MCPGVYLLGDSKPSQVDNEDGCSEVTTDRKLDKDARNQFIEGGTNSEQSGEEMSKLTSDQGNSKRSAMRKDNVSIPMADVTISDVCRHSHAQVVGMEQVGVFQGEIW